MRLWSFHPTYLDNIGLGRCWSEGLGGLRALAGEQQMHRNHSQLIRFKATGRTMTYLIHYLYRIRQHRLSRGNVAPGTFNLDALLKYGPYVEDLSKLTVTTGQVEYEIQHLLNKLSKRSRAKYQEVIKVDRFKMHTLFTEVPGPVASWEKIK